LQIAGVIVGAVVVLLGVAIATERVPLPGHSARGDGAAAGGSAPQTTVVTDSTRRQPPTT
jgi:hypothetical protein